MIKSLAKSLVCVAIAIAAMATPALTADTPDILVGRVNYIEGSLLRYIPDAADWVATVKDAPFGTGDTLFSGTDGMAELTVPNGTLIRVGNSTQIQFIALDATLSTIDVASGEARFYNRSSDTVVKVTSPFGYVLAYPGTAFDFYVGETSVEAVAVKGTVSFVHQGSNAKYDIAAGYSSILADKRQVSSGEGSVDPDWDWWNTNRENYRASIAGVRGRSAEYLPPSLQDESYVLEQNGRWEKVRYDGTDHWFWRPTTVYAGWSPFTVGRWTDWNGEQTWIPEEPFGYVTHHYGNWIYAGNHWYWAPPALKVSLFGITLLDVSFYWYPGRVSWIYNKGYVGWVPLAPRETYYSHHYWGGPHNRVMAGNTRVDINLRNHAFADHAVIVRQDSFYGVNSYRNVRVTNIRPTTVINTYHAAPVVNNVVINNYTTNTQRFNYTNITVNEKPHSTVVNRIRQNETSIRGGKREDPAMLQQQVKKMPEGRIDRGARIEAPKITNNIVPANEVNRPKSEMRLQPREIKGNGGREPQGRPGMQQPGMRPDHMAKPEPAAKPQGPVPQATVAPGATPAAAPAQSVPSPRMGQPGVQPARPDQNKPERPVQMKPGQSQPGQAAVKPDVARPEGAPVQPIQSPRMGQPSVRPTRPDQDKPERPGQVRPGQFQQGPGAVKPDVARPEGAPAAVRPQQPAPRPERVTRPEPTVRPQVAPSPAPAPAPTVQPRATKPEPVAKPQVAPSTPTPAPAVKPSPAPANAAPARVTPPAQKPAAPKPENAPPAKPGQKDKDGKDKEKEKDEKAQQK